MGEQGPQLYFQKELLYLDLYKEGNERCKVIQSQPKKAVLSLNHLNNIS